MSSISPAQSYLDTKARKIIEPLILATLNERPEEPILFMINWLKNLKGESQVSYYIKEREELYSLRIAFDKYSNLNKERESSESLMIKDDEVRNSSDSEDDDDIEQDKLWQELNKRKIQMSINKRVRQGISAEAYGKFNQLKCFNPKIIIKTDEQIKRIKDRVIQSFLFNCLDYKDLETVINAMEEIIFNENEYVINQGESGDVLYLVDSGTLECYKKKEDGPKYLKTYNDGEAFGELSLLYNVPRAASIKTKTKCILFSLDRETFNNIVRQSSIEQYINFLKSIEWLNTIDSYELSILCDALQPFFYNKDQFIIKQNDPADKFYILVEGKAYATISINGNKPLIVKEYKEGDYFGELALLKNAPRAASIIAKTSCKLLSLDRLSFRRLLRPVENRLKMQSEEYKKFV